MLSWDVTTTNFRGSMASRAPSPLFSTRGPPPPPPPPSPPLPPPPEMVSHDESTADAQAAGTTEGVIPPPPPEHVPTAHIPADEAFEINSGTGGEAAIGDTAGRLMTPIATAATAATLPTNVLVLGPLTEAQSRAIVIHARLGHITYSRKRAAG